MKVFKFKRGDIVEFSDIKCMVVGLKHLEDESGIRRYYVLRLLNREGINSVLNVDEGSVNEWVEPISVGDVIPTTIAKNFFYNLPVDTVIELEDDASDAKYVYLKTSNEGKYVRSNSEVDNFGNITVAKSDVLHYYVVSRGCRARIVYMPVRTLTDRD